MNRIIIFIFIITFFVACEKQPGEGGTSVIEGQVYKLSTFQNANTGSIDTLYFQLDAKKDVYIIYGDLDNTHDDDVKTSHDGSFEFKHLNTGNYEIYVYSECWSCPNGQDSLVKVNTTINNRSEIVDLGTITIINKQ